MNNKENKRILTASELMDILKDVPEDSPIVIIKDASDNGDEGCYYVTEVAKLHSNYEEKNDGIGLSTSNTPKEIIHKYADDWDEIWQNS